MKKGFLINKDQNIINMNQSNRSLELSINRLALTLESLEEYVRHADYYSDRKSKEQFYRRVIQGSNK